MKDDELPPVLQVVLMIINNAITVVSSMFLAYYKIKEYKINIFYQMITLKIE